MIESMREEIEAMVSGHFIPYHKLCFLVALIVTTIFSFVLSNNKILDGKVAVVDLDRSHTTATLIERIDASAYIEVTSVFHTPVDVKQLLAHDAQLGVLYFPHGTEETLKRRDETVRVGYFADNANVAQNAETLQALSAILASEGAAFSASAVAQLGLNPQQTEAILHPMSLSTRYLFNAVGSWTNTLLNGFLHFFSSIYLAIALLMVIGRLHVTGLWRSVVFTRSPFSLIARIVPYASFYTAVITLAMGVSVAFNDMRFVGNFLAYVPCIFGVGLSIGMIAMLCTWNHATPAGGPAFMTFFIPPGFIFGGVTIALGYLPQWVYYVSNAFPLVWQFRFFRDFGLRGMTLTDMLPVYGGFLIYLSILALFIVIRFYRSKKEVETFKTELEEMKQSLRLAKA